MTKLTCAHQIRRRAPFGIEIKTHCGECWEMPEASKTKARELTESSSEHCGRRSHRVQCEWKCIPSGCRCGFLEGHRVNQADRHARHICWPRQKRDAVHAPCQGHIAPDAAAATQALQGVRQHRSAVLQRWPARPGISVIRSSQNLRARNGSS